MRPREAEGDVSPTVGAIRDARPGVGPTMDQTGFAALVGPRFAAPHEFRAALYRICPQRARGFMVR